MITVVIGKRLGCFCAPQPCHGNNYVILVEKLNPCPLF